MRIAVGRNGSVIEESREDGEFFFTPRIASN